MGDKLKKSYDDALYNRRTEIGKIVDDGTHFDIVVNKDRLISRLITECEQQKAEAKMEGFNQGVLAALISLVIIIFLVGVMF